MKPKLPGQHNMPGSFLCEGTVFAILAEIILDSHFIAKKSAKKSRIEGAKGAEITSNPLKGGDSVFFASVPSEDTNIEIHQEIERMIEAYGNDVLRVAFLYLKDKHRAEDAFQEVFVKVFRKFDSFQGKSNEKTWLIKITINVCKDMLRSAWFKRVITRKVVEEPGLGEVIEDHIIQTQQNRRLFEEVMRLPTAYREVIILYYYQEMDTSQAAKVLGVAEGTVRSRLSRARELLKSNLAEEVESFG